MGIFEVMVKLFPIADPVYILVISKILKAPPFSLIAAFRILTINPLKMDEHRLAKTLKTMQKALTIRRLGYNLNNCLRRRSIVPFLARPLSLILIGGILFFTSRSILCVIDFLINLIMSN